MSVQSSLLESGGECGQANPALDVAHQFTGGSVAPGGLGLDDLAATFGPSGMLHDDHDDGHLVLESAVDGLLQDGTSPFNMESLLEEMSRMEKQQEAVFSNALRPESKDPALSEAIVPPDEIWAENEGNFSHKFGTRATSNEFDLPNLDGDWAEEYLKRVESGEVPGIDLLVETQEDRAKMADRKRYRNQPMGADTAAFSFSSLTPFGKPTAGTAAITTQAENDMFEDQERRLVNLLLGPNQSNNEATASTAKVNAKTATGQDGGSVEGENFFYENQFDDMEFWLKLAEEWVQQDSDVAAREVAELELDQAVYGRVVVKIVEPLEELLREDHTYHYRAVENNPLKAKKESDEPETTPQLIDYIGQGKERMSLGDLPAAVLLFEAATQQEPERCEGWRLLGVAQAKNENDHKAICALKRCLALQPTDGDALLCLATSYTNESMPTEACYTLQMWLKNHAEYKDLVRDPPAQVKESSSSTPTKPTTEPYQGPTPLSKRWSSKTSQQGSIFANGFFDSVREQFLEAASRRQDQPDADVQCALGVLLNLSGEYDKAADCFRTAVAVRQEDHTLWNRLGATLANGGKSDEAMSAYREALIRYPGYIRARYNLAISCILLGVAREAIDHLLTVLNFQSAGPNSVSDTVARISQDHITSASVWNTFRSALMLIGRSDLFPAVDTRDLELLNREFAPKQEEPQVKEE